MRKPRRDSSLGSIYVVGYKNDRLVFGRSFSKAERLTWKQAEKELRVLGTRYKREVYELRPIATYARGMKLL